jgi:CheY-like chemotaxis protein
MKAGTEVTKSIFYIDDDQDDLDFFKDVIVTMDRPVELFMEPNDMMNTLHNPPPLPSVIFLDLNMNLKTGFELLQEIKESENFNHVPLIVYSTTSSYQAVERCRALGASLFVTKPTSFTELQKILEYVTAIDWENHQPDSFNFVYRNNPV